MTAKNTEKQKGGNKNKQQPPTPWQLEIGKAKYAIPK
jgi:hypothetical protein